ncbi:hypothetical protein ACLKMH_05515 [Psychromonas sp. KJ10-10]|uniref:hypothetical protein n=1 Tax=Psychromonas sp. KJ10-10 TaxID=3391823 RepID=UPI0039B5DACF
MSADPIIQDPFISNSFNRYAYVVNNPLKYTDPTGFFWEEVAEAAESAWDSITSFFGGNGNNSESNEKGSSTSNDTKTTAPSIGEVLFEKTAKSYDKAIAEFNILKTDAIDLYNRVDKKKLAEETIYLSLNTIGAVGGSILVAFPEPTTLSKVLGGLMVTKSVSGVGLNLVNIKQAWIGESTYVPNTLASLLTSDMTPTAQKIGNVADLSLDLFTGMASRKNNN